MTLPTAAVVSLLVAIDEALALAEAGDPAAGYLTLILSRARSLEGERNFEPWADELEGRWDRAVETFAARWGIGRA